MKNHKITAALFLLINCFSILIITKTPLCQDLNIIVYTSYYSRDDTVYSNLYSMYPDGSAKTQITAFYPYSAKEPVFSGDGSHLAFTSNLASFKSSNYEDIFRLDLTTSALVRVTGNEYVSADKTGSLYVSASDDTRLNLSSQEMMVSYQGTEKIYTLEEAIKLGKFTDVPAGNIWIKIVKNKWIGGLDFVEVPPGGVVGAEIKYTDGNFLAGQPSWSSDGTKIAGVSGYAYYDTGAFNADGSLKNGRSQYAGIDTIGVWDLNGIPADQLEASPATLGTNIHPRFSPAGSSLAYCKGPFPTQSIVVVPCNNLNGSETMIAQGGTDYTTLQSYGYLDPDWSPDGTRIACSYVVYDTSLNLTGNIVITDSSGSGQITQITSLPSNSAAGGVDFSPDGQWVAYTVMTSKNSRFNFLDLALYNFTADIYIQNLQTGEQIQITDDGGSTDPAWAFATAQPQISASTTTTRTGDPDTKKCPFVVSLENQADIVIIRQLRKFLNRKDPFLVDIFHEHSAEVACLLTSNAELKYHLKNLVNENMKAVRNIIRTGKASISPGSVKNITDFLKKLYPGASPQLQGAVNIILKEIKEGELLQTLGIDIQNSGDTLLNY